MAEQNKRDINLAEMSDDEISNLDPDSFAAAEETESDTPPLEENKQDGSQDQEQDLSAAEAETDDTGDDETDGADSSDESTELEAEAADSTSAEEPTDIGTAPDPFDEKPTEAPEAHQASEQDETDSDEAGETSDEVDYKAEFNRVMAPFRAAKREIKLNNIDDARRLMQMGVDYSRKMEAMKPYQRVLQTLEKNNLLDVERLNFLIDLDKKNPDAIKKFLKDSDIDPMDLSLEDNTDYKPNDHMVAEQEVVLNEVLSDLKQTDTFDRLAIVISEEWDTASRQVLYQDPGIIRALNDNMQSGVFDQIADEMARERILGRLTGLSDLEAYKTVGDAIQARNGWKQPATGKEPSTEVQSSQKSGSKRSAKADELRTRRRAASSPKGTPSPGHQKVDLAKLSDEEIEKLDYSAL
jgi:hypothetical protein